MTNFFKLGEIEKITKETVFTHAINGSKTVKETSLTPKDFKNVLWLGCDHEYGDMFKCWDNDSEFTIMFGIKGDEF